MHADEDAAAILGLLADPRRLRVLSALVLGASSLEEVARATGLRSEEAGRAIARLISGGLVRKENGRYGLALEKLQQPLRGRGHRSSIAGESGVPLEAAKVLRSFFRDGRLNSIPSARAKRLVVLDHVAQRFEPGRHYPEREVNSILRGYHEDFAALRRYLVDEGFLDRDGREYWRAGGTFSLD